MPDAHTPGPWTARMDDGDYWEVVAHDGSPPPWNIAILPGMVNFGKDDAANARLIAAAPELLEALKAIEAHASNFYTATNTIARSRDANRAFKNLILDECAKAIARAEGRG